jgi:hypothetical protein
LILDRASPGFFKAGGIPGDAMIEQDHLITEEMLARIAEYHQSTGNWTVHYDRLQLDQINQLLIFPARALLRLVCIIEKDNVLELVSEGFGADAQEDFLSFWHISGVPKLYPLRLRRFIFEPQKANVECRIRILNRGSEDNPSTFDIPYSIFRGSP